MAIRPTGETGDGGDGETGDGGRGGQGTLRVQVFYIALYPPTPFSQKGRKGSKKRRGGRGGSNLPPHLPLLPSPFLGEGVGVRALALEYLSDLFCFDKKPALVRTGGRGGWGG